MENLSKQIFNALDENINKNFSMKPVDRSLDLEKCFEYLSLFDDDNYRNFAKEVIDNTLYVNFYELKENLMKSFIKFKEEINDRAFSIFFSSKKIGSENWLLHILWPLLRTLNVEGFVTDDEFLLRKEGRLPKEILIIDDCSYSGIHVCGIVDELPYFASGYGEDDNLTGPRTVISKFHVLIPYMTEFSKSQIKSCEDTSEVVFHNIHELTTLQEKSDDINEKFGIELIGCPIYFDHKVANNFGTFPMIYKDGLYFVNGEKRYFGSLLKEPTSRYKIEQLRPLYFDLQSEILYTEENFKKEKEFLRSKTLYIHDDYLRDSEKYSKLVKYLPAGDNTMRGASEIILGKLYLGGAIFQDDTKERYVNLVTYEQLKDLGVTNILQVGNEYNDMNENFTMKQIQLKDNFCENLYNYFQPTIDFINSGKCTYVHCILGKSRSASVVIVYVAKTLNLDFVEAYNYVYERRNFIEPNIGFMYQMAKFIHG